MFNSQAFIRSILAMLVSLGVYVTAFSASPAVQVPDINDFSQLASNAQSQRKLIMIEVSASDCSYCRLLEREVIKPMIRSGEYDNDVIIGKIEIDETAELIGFDGKPTTGAELAKQWNATMTPTLIFLNAQNQEVSKRIVGVNSLDFFGAYVDKAIDLGLSAIR